MVSYGGKTIPRWRTAAILKIDISPYISEKSSNFHEIWYTAADFELDERHVIKNDKVALDRLRVRQNVFLVDLNFFVAYQSSVPTFNLTYGYLSYCSSFYVVSWLRDTVVESWSWTGELTLSCAQLAADR